MSDSVAALLTGALAALATPAMVAAQATPANPSQTTVARQDISSAIWAPRPGNINNEIVGQAVIPEELLAEYLDLHSALEYSAAAAAARKLIETCPDRPEGYYNLACSLAQMRKHDAALAALDDAIDRGWRFIRHTWIDPDLETLHDVPTFAELMLKMARLEHAERVVPRTLRTDDWQSIEQSLRERIPQLLDQYDVPGVTVALVHDGAMVWTDAFGYSNPHQEIPMVVHDQFQLHAPVDLMVLMATQQQTQHGLDLAETLAQADELDLRDHPQRLARGTVPRYVDVDRDLRARLLADDNGQPPAANAYELRRRAIDRTLWPISQVIPRTVDWLASAVEIVAGQTFYGYCNHRILRPAGMQETLFALPPGRNHTRPADAGQVVLAAPSNDMVIGHTRFGTPLIPVERPLRTQIAPVRTTAADLGRLMASIMQSSRRPLVGNLDDVARAAANDADAGAAERPPAVLDNPLEDLLESARLHHIGLGLEVHLDETVVGPRVQVIENTDGLGMLMRWYPESGDGIVVLFNSESGPEAALRIAHEALGGE